MSFIVIEGLDGAGKSTQIELLKRYLTGKNIESEYIHFPTTDSRVFGSMISRFLRGEFGGLDDVNPYLVALLFAGDRFNLAEQINSWQEDGKVVINDRYVYSNIGFQCAKLDSDEEADKLFDWIFDLEYDYFKIPRPDLSIFLDVPFDFTTMRLTENRSGKDREYLEGKIDIHESSLDFQKNVKKSYLKAIARDDAFIRIDCSDEEGNMLPSEEISKLVIGELVQRKLV